MTNKYTLILGSVLGLLVPLANGMVTGNWLWVSWASGYSDIFLIDAFWLITSISALLIGLKIKTENQRPIIADRKVSA